MIETPNKSVDNQPKGSARSPSETLDRSVGDSRRVTKPAEQDAALEAVGARRPRDTDDPEVTSTMTSGQGMAEAAEREPGQREANLDQDRREAAEGLKPATG